MHLTGTGDKGLRKSTILVTCAKGIMPFLRKEINALKFPVLSESVAGIETEGTPDDALRLNLMLRTGHRVLFLIRHFTAGDADALYRKVSEIPWEHYIDEHEYLTVTSSVENPGIKDSRFANMKCKDAIVDRIRKKRGSRPDSGPGRHGVVVNLFWREDRCSLYFDTSGDSLSRRGYRKIPLDAPMQETLAAAVVIATGWKGERNFINPMCGSGTLAIEAVLSALRVSPGILRDNFGFMHIRGFRRNIWKALCDKALKGKRKELGGRVIATDIRREAVESARKNARAAGIEHLIEFSVCDYADTPVPEGGGVVVLNPEYGERMGKAVELEYLYRGIGDFFKQKCRGYTGYIFTGNLKLAKQVGLRTRRRVQFYNGPIECRLLEYELYEGTRKNNKSNKK